MKTGEAAIKRMAESDAARGLVEPQAKRSAEAAYKAGRQASQAPVAAASDGALNDRALAENMLAQAQRMEAEAKGLIAEAARMKKEAERMDPVVARGKTTVNSGEAKPKRTRASAKTKGVVTDAAQ
jgi:hypothetical protein